jgi:two-component system, cell cycle sensor histidine kinase and response regulator CckA
MVNPLEPVRDPEESPANGIGESAFPRGSLLEVQNQLDEIKHLVDNSPIVLFRWKAAEGWPVEFVSENVLQFGYTADSFRSGARSYASIVFAEDLDRVWQEVQHYSESGVSRFEQEYRLVAGDGTIRWISDRTLVERDGDGRIRSYQGIIFDITERKKAEDASRFIQFAIDHMAYMANWMTADGRFLYLNDAGCRTLGYTREELLTMSVPDITPDMTAEAYKQHWEELKQKGSMTFEAFNRSKSGRVYPVEVQANYVVIDGTEYNFSFATDITERKKAETALQTSAHRFSVIFNSSPLTMTLMGLPEGIFLEVNEAFSKMYGYSRDEVIGNTAPNLGIWVDIEDRNRYLRALGDSGYVQELETRMRRKDGTVIDVLFSGFTTEIDGLGCILNVAQDITERKKTDDMLLFLAQRSWTASGGNFLSSLVRNLAELLSVDFVFIGRKTETEDAVVTVTLCADGSIRPNFEYYLAGTPSENIIGQQLRCFPSGIQKLFPGDLLLHELEAEGYAGIPLWDSQGLALGLLSVISRSPLLNEQLVKSMLQMVAVRASGELERMRFEEAQARLNEQLFQAQKMESIGLLAGGVAHDFNNLMTPIILYAEQVLASLPEQDPNLESLERIIQSAHRAGNLTKRLLSFSRKQILDLKEVYLEDVIQQFAIVLHSTIPETIQIRIQAGSSHSLIRADKGQIEQVLLNLVINAQDAMPNGGELDININDIYLDETYTAGHPEVLPGDYVMLSVSDTGTGMDAETIDHIFEPFFTSKEVGKGTGLGLSTVYGIVKQHGGSIFVYSEKGKGSIFKIFFPKVLDECAANVEQPLHRTGPVRGQETILVVEDNEMVRHSTCRMLENLGYHVIEALDVEVCQELARQHGSAIDLLLTDVVMPGMNGKELSALLKREHPKLKILYMSGYTRNVIDHDSVLEDGVHFIQKPFALNAISKKIREALES